jgi:hypothetical protein
MTFVYDINLSESLMDIITYLEKKAPGTRATQSDAIRYAIELAAINIREELAKEER